jgi:hypothetical protein
MTNTLSGLCGAAGRLASTVDISAMSSLMHPNQSRVPVYAPGSTAEGHPAFLVGVFALGHRRRHRPEPRPWACASPAFVRGRLRPRLPLTDYSLAVRRSSWGPSGALTTMVWKLTNSNKP